MTALEARKLAEEDMKAGKTPKYTDLRDWLASHAPAGPWHYPEDEVSDAPLRQLAAEITREKMFLQLHQEAIIANADMKRIKRLHAVQLIGGDEALTKW